ncbi:MAG: chondroitinase-B domain-containing protein [Bergeyella sp.]
MIKQISILFCFFTVFGFGQNAPKRIVKVNDINALNLAVKNGKPGDEIVMKNGIWNNVEIVFSGNGTEENPIILRAEEAGKVTIEGQSNLQLGGKYLVVKDLYFKNGYSLSKNLIQFKTDKTVANHCKITNCVIEEFTKPDRSDADHWIEFWGRNNELSNCYISGKSNSGPTIMVRLDGNENINNYHKITGNYFGERPRKGGPHGETIQIGDSETSMTPSHTIVKNNLFEHCNGEVEIISSKSNDNEFTGNVFFESEGSLVLRHGNYAKIDGNVFIGNDNSEFIGGIRVINTGHWITNNYFYKLKGKMFRSPICVMNGIPKAAQNRYNQVTDVVLAFNTFVDCQSPLQFGVGSNISQSKVLPKSEIRSARPKRTVVANNMIYNHLQNQNPIIAHDSLDGISFQNNIFNSKLKDGIAEKGMEYRNFEMKQLSDNLFVPMKNFEDVYHGFDFETITKDFFGKDRTAQNTVGSMIVPVDNQSLINKKNYGTNWFNPEKPTYKPKILLVSNVKEFKNQLLKAHSGDIISLKKGIYDIKETLAINKDITIISSNENEKAELRFASPNTAFEISPKTNLRISNVILKGNGKQNTFTTLQKNMSKAYNLFLKNVEISNFDSVLEVSKSSFADTISVANSVIENCNRGFVLNKETDDLGEYNAEFVIIKNTKFNHIKESLLDYYRGGYDESTIGGNLVFQNNTVTESGQSVSDKILIKNRGIVNVEFFRNAFKNNPVNIIAVLWGEKDQKPVENVVENSGEIKVVQNLELKLMY